jgi:hypothetical protein
MISLLAIARITGPASASGRVSPTSGRLPALRGEQVGRRFGRAPGADGRARGEWEVPAPVEPDTCIDAGAALMRRPSETPVFVPKRNWSLGVAEALRDEWWRL